MDDKCKQPQTCRHMTSCARTWEHFRHAIARGSRAGTAKRNENAGAASELPRRLVVLDYRSLVILLRQAQLPKWRGSFQWQIEAKIEALQAEYARLRAEAAKPDG